jgi:hypothetical protein
MKVLKHGNALDSGDHFCRIAYDKFVCNVLARIIMRQRMRGLAKGLRKIARWGAS